MNILPKKRWHVRTKDNIARVRRDEAEAAEQERKRVEKQEYAESEARLNLLRSKAAPTPTLSRSTTTETSPTGTIITSDGHVDLFSDFQSHIKTTNKEHEKEKKDELEKYEKQIGYLTYLGQDTNEALKLRSWYERPPDRAEVGAHGIVEKDLKTKYQHDPLTLIKTLLPEPKIVNKLKHVPSLQSIRKEITEPEVSCTAINRKKEKKHKKDKKKNSKDEKRLRNEQKRSEEVLRKKEFIDRLRKERLKRETRERARQEELLSPKVDKPKIVQEVRGPPRIVQKYNSQFNPELAKQNMA